MGGCLQDLFNTACNIKTVLLETIQFSIGPQFSSTRPIDKSLSGATTPGENGPGSDGNKGVLRVPQSFSITGDDRSFSAVSRTDVGGSLTPLRRGSRCILQLHLIWPKSKKKKKTLMRKKVLMNHHQD